MTDNLAERSPSRVRVDVEAAAGRLLTGLVRQPWGQASPSIYETARLVALAPWLAGHAERVRYLLRQQRADGGWGGLDGYELVPTLSATEAMIASARSSCGPAGASDAELVGAADRGLRALSGWLAGHSHPPLPDTPAVDLIVPALVELLNRHLEQLPQAPVSGLDAWAGVRLPLPAGLDRRRLDAVRQRLVAGGTVPDKLLHALEVAGGLARGVRSARVARLGSVGASPAATAAWLGDPAGSTGAARSYLEEVVARNAALAPCATPITVFERAWVLSGLSRAGVPLSVAPELRGSLSVDLGPAGTPAAPGLPTDADTTSVTLYALALIGDPVDPECLWAYDTGSHFCTWPGEDGSSVTTNAHVLDAFGHHLGRGGSAARYRGVVQRLSDWLCDQQRPDGSWWDRWHASPYYATAGCVLALGGPGRPARTIEAIDRARKWVVDTQRPDGSWGRWWGTVEETAYALHVLLGPRRPVSHRIAAAANGGYAFLRRFGAPRPDWRLGAEQPPLWHDKDLYRPDAIVEAAILGALWLARDRMPFIQEPVQFAMRRM